MKRLAARLRAWETEIHRWNNSRALVCDHGCDFRPRRTRTSVAWYKVAMHAQDFPGHTVKVRRRG